MNSLQMRAADEPTIIKVGYAFSRIVSPPASVTLTAREFSAIVRNARYSQAVQLKRWDGRTSLINKRDGSFGTGLLPDVVGYIKYKLKGEVIIEDLRQAPEKMYDFTWEFPHPLTDAQNGAVKALKNGVCGILKMPTGVGKTAVASKLIQELGVRTIFCVHSKELLRQTADVLERNLGGDDVKIGLLGDGHWPDEDCSIVVAMYPTITRLRGDRRERSVRQQYIETMGSFDLLICDECHKICTQDAITKTWEAVMDINAYYRIGVSATPYEQTGTIAEMLLRSAFGHILYNMDIDEAREAGYITPFTAVILKPQYPAEMTRVGTTGMTYADAHDYFIGNNAVRNEAVVEAVKLLLADGRKTLVVAQRINQNELLAKLLAEAIGEDNVYMLHGQLEAKYRKESMSAFKGRSDPCVMVASSVGNDGIDIPDISGIVLAHGGQSFFQNVQRVGRGLRLADGKTNLMFVDFDDSALGRWFRKHTARRLGYYKDMGAEIIRDT